MRRISGFQQAGEAWREPRTDGQGQAITGNRGCINPRPSGLYSKIVDQEPGFKIVSAIEKEIAGRKKLPGILRAKIGHHALYVNTGIDGAQSALGRDGFRKRFERV